MKKRPAPKRTVGHDTRQSTATDNPTEPLLVSARRAAKMLGISTRTLWSMSVSGEIPSVKLRSRRLYPVADLVAWIEKNKTRGGTGG